MRFALLIFLVPLIAGCKPDFKQPASRPVAATAASKPATYQPAALAKVTAVASAPRDGKQYDLVGDIQVTHLMGFPDGPLPAEAKTAAIAQAQAENSPLFRALIEMATLDRALGMEEPKILDPLGLNWQFQLTGGRGALVMWEPNECVSLMLIYPSGQRVDASTSDGSLEAWVLRDSADQPAPRDAPLAMWEHFLAVSRDDRSRDRQAFALTGSANLRFAGDGLADCLNLKLHSASPLPPSEAYLKKEHDIYASDASRLGAVPKPSESIQSLDDYFKLPFPGDQSVEYDRRMLWSVEYYKTHGATMNATIEGTVYGAWHRPPPHIVWP